MVDLLTPYKYFFYRFYIWQVKLWSKDEGGQYNALFFLSVLVLLNFFTVLWLVGFALNINFLRTGIPIVVQGLVVGFGLVGLGYLILVKDGRYRAIAKRFSKESKSARTRNLIFCILYVVATFVLFFNLRNWFPQS